MPSSRPAARHPLGTLVRTLNVDSERLVQSFAESRGIYQTDFRALLMMTAAQAEGRLLTAGELAVGLQLSSGAVTYLVERLTQAGHAEREADPRDRRRVLLQATPAGEQVASDFRGLIDTALNDAFGGYDEEQMALLADALARLNAGILAGARDLGSPARH